MIEKYNSILMTVLIIDSWTYAVIAALESFNLQWAGSNLQGLNEQILTNSVGAGSCSGGFPGNKTSLFCYKLNYF